jgi:hypothetical protein
MAAEVETIRCNFIGDFKVGDNILVNGNALCRLSAMNEKNTFNKLMVVQAGSIVEAALDQIIYRVLNYTREGVPSIPVEDLYKIRGRKIERFNNIIQTMKTRKLLDGLGGTIYDDLHRLRKLRNRVHIQFDDEPEGLGRDDHLAFSAKEVIWSPFFVYSSFEAFRGTFSAARSAWCVRARRLNPQGIDLTAG